MMRKKALSLIAFLVILLAGNQSVVFGNSHIKHNNITDNSLNVKKPKCPFAKNDPSDFNYEIILSLSTFPPIGSCSEEEETQISSLLEKTINDEVDALPGTIKTKNKVCDTPVNQYRRQLLQSSSNKKMDNEMESGFSRSFLRSANPRNGRRVLHRRRSFIYVGGGKCRFCLNDNADQRALFPASRAVHNENRHAPERDLLFFSLRKTDSLYPKVSDVSLCKHFHRAGIHLVPGGSNLKWINGKETTIPLKSKKKSGTVIGPYEAGERFSIQFDAIRAFEAFSQRSKRSHEKQFGRHAPTFIKRPVKDVTLTFWFYAIDLPEAFATRSLDDDPFYLFINGLKLDFNLLIAQPGAKIDPLPPNFEDLSGSSFAGIKWKIRRVDSFYNNDFAGGPEPDRYYVFVITAPLILLSHKNQLDIDFIIKPQAKAKSYAFRYLTAGFNVAKCEVTGMENSRFEDFQSVVESRLFQKLGMDLAHQFQSKQGHCLHDKIPVVDVHLVEKENWKESNPQCRQLAFI